ncbi:MAG: hypothetical protein IJ125_07235, partial [Atopobiaceae bacterium]|nr:hypothetical protein [Atopobiaceae bacterium]
IQKDNKASVLQGIIRSGLITRAVWTKVVSRELVENNDILFPLGLRNEDTDWTGKVIECAQSVVWYEESFYAYRKGTDYAQTSKPLTQQVVDDLAQVILGRLESIHNKGLSDKEKHVCNAYLAYPYVVWMGQASVLHLNADNDRYFSQMKDAAPLLIGAHDDPAVSKIYYLYKIAGFNITMKALGFVFRRRYPSVVAGNHQQESS